MLAHGADIQARTANGRTALHFASVIGRVATMEWLLQHGANINAQDKLGQTPLLLATQNDTTSAAHLLLMKGADPNMANIDGETTLFYSVASPIGESLLPELLAHGANPNLWNRYGKTVLHLPNRCSVPNSSPSCVTAVNDHEQKKQRPFGSCGNPGAVVFSIYIRGDL